MTFSRISAAVLLAACVLLLAGCNGMKVETPGPFPYNSRYG